MTRDPALESRMIDDLDHPAGITSRAMFGGLCYMLHGNMLCGAWQGRAMYRVGRDAQAHALRFPGTRIMTQGSRAMPGYVALSGDPLADDDLRQSLARMSLDFVSHLPAKDV